MKLSEILRAGKANIEKHGWGQGIGEVLFGRPNKCCALTAISIQKTGCMEQINECVAAVRLFRGVNGFGTSTSVAQWNDAPERTLSDVLAAYDKAITAAEAQEKT